MAVEVVVPAEAAGSSETNLARWLKSEGEPVATGDVIAEIETDKAVLEVTAACDGRIGRILVPAGSKDVKADQVIAMLLEEGEAEVQPAEAVPVRVPAEPAAAPPDVPPPPVRAPVSAAGIERGGRVFASPRARALAAQSQLDLSRLSGSGPHGRIVRSDVEAALGKDRATASPFEPGLGSLRRPDERPASYREIPHTLMRRTIARRLTQAKQQAPHFYLSIDCNVDALLELRRQINAGRETDKVSVNDMVIRAAALALRQVPTVNSSWTETCVRQYDTVDISVAVATPGGLVTPLVRAADTKSVEAIAAEMKQLAARAQQAKLAPEEYQGGTFSVSNLGMYGIRAFTAVINPPQGAILAIGAAESRPIARDGALAVATMMACTLSADHRVVDGAVGAEFLASFRKLIEEPRQLLAP